MRMMYEQSIQPVLAEHSAGGTILISTVHCFGAGESDIAEKIRDLMRPGRNPAVGTTARQGVIGIRVQSRGSDVEQARRLLNEDITELQKRLGVLVFGRDEQSLASVVADLLTEQGKTVATAESCTGGLIAKMLTDVPGSSKYFKEGLVTYSNPTKIRLLTVPEDQLKTHGAVSSQVAKVMATNCREKANADYALSVTGIAGPSGGTPHKPVGLVYIGLADKDGCQVVERRLGEHLNRSEIRMRTACNALNTLRLRILGKKFHN
jgi:nicotinamide-nucleotide amidase